MAHIFSDKPVILRILDLKKNTPKQCIVFIGNVDTDIKKELQKLEKAYNAGKIYNSTKIKKYYGNDYKQKLGLQDNKIIGGKDSNSAINNEFANVISSIVGGEEQNIIRGDLNDDQIISNAQVISDDDQFMNNDDQIINNDDQFMKDAQIINNVQFMNDDRSIDQLSTPGDIIHGGEDIEYEIPDFDMDIIGEIKNVGNQEDAKIVEEIKEENVKKEIEKTVNNKSNKSVKSTNVDQQNEPNKSAIQVAPIRDLEIQSDIQESTDLIKLDDLLEVQNQEQVISLEKSSKIKFIFDLMVYPEDNILEFKYKIYLITGIPIYRQHLWFNYKNKPINSYSVEINKHNISTDIYRLIDFYNGNIKMDEVEGIPINQDMYKNKDFIQVIAQDTFTLMLTNYEKYNTVSYNLIDLNDLIDQNTIYKTLSKDKYQLDMIYYGFIMLYFPIITYNVFHTYIKNEKAVKDSFSELIPDRGMLRRKYDLEQKITLECYNAEVDNKNIKNKLYSSITSTILNIEFKQDIELLVSLRNLFDIIQLNENIPFCKASLLHDNKHIILRKSYQNDKEPKESILLNSLMLKIKLHPDTLENMRLIIFKNGNYIVKTDWREEAHMDFNKIIKIVQQKVNPIIQLINKLGTRVKYYDIDLPLINPAIVTFVETSMAFYYEDDVSDKHFDIFKQILDDYRKADIILQKEVIINQNILEYFFNRGMYKFDARRIDKTTTLQNYYDYLSNGVIRQKWSTIFERTRLLQIMHISGKLKIFISGIKNDTEMMFFHIYLTGMLSIYNENSKQIKTHSSSLLQTKSKKALKNLKLQDPLLYDFKKIYKSNVVYSKICQKPYQPLLLNEKEFSDLPGDKKSKAIKYWNFTKQKPVWYSCPNPKYPYIKFIIKQHPKDFCIPCCKKVAMHENVNVKKQEIHKTCLKDYEYKGEKISLTKGSHYIATYGKDIEVGRLSRLPEHTLEPLFFDTYSPEDGIDQECITQDGYYLFGVDQHLPTIKNIGYLYCVIHALNTSVDDFLLDCINRIKKSPDHFYVLLDGKANMYFTDYRELIDTLAILNKDTLLDNKYETLPWNELFMSIVYYYHGINNIIFSDKDKERIDMVLPKGLKNVDDMFPNSHKNLIVLQKKVKYYPIYMLNTELFKRTGIIDYKLFLNESGLVTIIRSVVRWYLENSEFEKVKNEITLHIMKNFVAYQQKQKKDIVITGYYINNTNLCYAVRIKYNKKILYIPINISHYSLDKDIELIFEPYDYHTIENNFSDLWQVINMYNKYIWYISKLEGMSINIYPIIEIQKWLAVKSKPNDFIGFVFGMMYYYCTVSEKTALNHTKAPIQYILYNPLTINRIIHNMKNKVNTDNNKLNSTLQKSMYEYYLYDLVILQFIAIFNKQRNIAMRKRILQTIIKTNFDKNLEPLKKLLDEITDMEDNIKLKNIISKFITVHHNKKQMISDIHETYFNFDRVEFEKMKTMDYKDVLKRIHHLSKRFVTFGDVEKKKNFTFPNILTSCESSNDINGYCAKGKFIIKKEKLNEILSILAHDIINPSKWKWLFNSIFIEKTVDYYKFIRRPGETITVEFIN